MYNSNLVVEEVDRLLTSVKDRLEDLVVQVDNEEVNTTEIVTTLNDIIESIGD